LTTSLVAELDGVIVGHVTFSANLDTPENIVRNYDEARATVGQSPESAADLLRLGIQKLCMHLGEPDKKLTMIFCPTSPRV
jgi:hypothetical protein